MLEERIGVPITVIPTKSWSQSLEYLRTGKCDLICSVVKGPKEEPGLAVSQPYLESAVVMVVG
ncbi:MAG: transporter substrate-binding domain-containing protein [Desulfovermiculus sp.]|nr:transporter substrate-binding domain-containing protein [Desulfovermiculus sp.]